MAVDEPTSIRIHRLLNVRRMYRALVSVVDEAMLVDTLWLMTPKGDPVTVVVMPGSVLASFMDGFYGLKALLDGTDRAELLCSAMIVQGNTGYQLQYPTLIQLRPLYRKLKGEVRGGPQKPCKTQIRRPPWP